MPTLPSHKHPLQLSVRFMWCELVRLPGACVRGFACACGNGPQDSEDGPLQLAVDISP